MTSPYSHPQIAGRIRSMGVLDRIVRLPQGACEHVVSIVVVTSDEGIVTPLVTIDLIGPNGAGVLSTMIAQYPMSHQENALSDARMLAAHHGLSLRGATAEVGWEQILPAIEDVLAPSADSDFQV